MVNSNVHNVLNCIYTTAPGKWSNVEGTKFGKVISEVYGDAELEGWLFSKQWGIIATTASAEGWRYATTIKSVNWHDTAEQGLLVRRRHWVAEIVKAPLAAVVMPSAPSITLSTEASAVSVSYPAQTPLASSSLSSTLEEGAAEPVHETLVLERVSETKAEDPISNGEAATSISSVLGAVPVGPSFELHSDQLALGDHTATPEPPVPGTVNSTELPTLTPESAIIQTTIPDIVAESSDAIEQPPLVEETPSTVADRASLASDR
jgi:hypothetical protein